MIEVEKKFILSAGDEQKLVTNAQFVGEKVFTDTYYDTSTWTLTAKDHWLRSRDGRYELKVPLNDLGAERLSDQYEELETDQEIATYLKLPLDIPLSQALMTSGYAPFCTLTTTRRKYKKDGFVIDIDRVDFGYDIAEIEYMVKDISEVRDATEKIITYGEQLGLKIGAVRGKVGEYLKRNSPEHFQVLVDAKVFS